MSTPSFVSVVLLVLLSTIVHPTTCLSVAQVQTLTGYINKFITSSTSFPPGGGPVRYPLLPALVRLAFHDCAGTACDGCVNLKIASNKGLQAVVSGLELLYNNSTLGIKTMPISRADFWALAGLVAVNFGATLQQSPPGAPPIAPYIPSSLVPTSAFKTGRKDCSTAPNGTESDSAFPDGLRNSTDTLAYFSTNFGFNATESVAILGAHTLGRATPTNSGFKGPWVARDNTLDNAYFVDMNNQNAGWAQTTVSAPGGKVQWQRTAPPPPGAPAGSTGPTLLMLNADMCLLKSFAISSTGQANCTYGTCKAASTAATVASYAANNNKWLDNFGAVFAKMQNICGRTTSGTTTTLTKCTLTSLTAARAASTAAVRAKVAAATSAPHVAEVVQQAAADADAAAAANAAEPFVDPRPLVVLPVAVSQSSSSPDAAAANDAVVVEGGRRHRRSAARKLA